MSDFLEEIWTEEAFQRVVATHPMVHAIYAYAHYHSLSQEATLKASIVALVLKNQELMEILIEKELNIAKVVHHAP